MAQWLIGGIGVLIILLGIQTKRIDDLKDKAANHKRTIQAHVTAAKHNAEQIEHCTAINAANEREAARHRENAEQAATRAKMLAAELDQRTAAIPAEAEEFNDEECRTLDEPLPADFVDWLRGT